MESAKPTVFVVEDDASFRRAVERLLAASGYVVESFASATEFMERQSPDRHGCLLLDVRLPDITGLELQHLVTTSGATTPIVFMTGHADVATCVRAMKGGAADFLIKPFEEAELLDAVERGLAKDQERRDRLGTKTVQDTFAATIKQVTPLGKPQTPADIAQAAMYLARADSVTGISLIVAGGSVM